MMMSSLTGAAHAHNAARANPCLVSAANNIDKLLCMIEPEASEFGEKLAVTEQY